MLAERWALQELGQWQRQAGRRQQAGWQGHVVVECGGLTAKESSSSIEQKKKRLEINGELDD
jgi:hypothetical protein